MTATPLGVADVDYGEPMPFPLRVHGLLVVPFISTVVVAGTIAAGMVGVGQAPARADLVAKTTIGVMPTAVAPPSTGVATPPTPATAPPFTAASVVATIPTVPPPTDAGVPTSEPSGLSPASLAAALPLFGLEATKLQCLAGTLTSFAADDNAALAGLQGCGVALMPVLRGVVDLAQRSSSFLDPTATTVPLPTPPAGDILPPEDAFYIGFLLLLLPEETQCLAAGLAAAPSDDDATALAIMQGCAVPLSRTLDMLLFALQSDASDPTVSTVPVATAAPTVPVATVGPATPTTLRGGQSGLTVRGSTISRPPARTGGNRVGRSSGGAPADPDQHRSDRYGGHHRCVRHVGGAGGVRGHLVRSAAGRDTDNRGAAPLTGAWPTGGGRSVTDDTVGGPRARLRACAEPSSSRPSPHRP